MPLGDEQAEFGFALERVLEYQGGTGGLPASGQDDSDTLADEPPVPPGEGDGYASFNSAACAPPTSASIDDDESLLTVQQDGPSARDTPPKLSAEKSINRCTAARDNNWHRVRLPLSRFANTDLHTVQQLFMLAGEAPVSRFTLAIDDVCWEETPPQ